MSAVFAGLRARLVLVVLLGLAPVAVLSLYMVWEQRNIAAATAEEAALRLARLAAARYQQTTEHAAHWLALAARLPAVQMTSSRECDAELGEILKQQQDFITLDLVAADGTVHCRGRVSAAQRPVDMALVRLALTRGGFVLGDYLPDERRGRPLARAAFPTAAGDKVLYATIDFAWLPTLAATALLPEQATLTIIDGAGNMLARHPVAPNVVGRNAAHTPMVQAVLRAGGKGTTTIEGIDGVRRLYGFTPLPTEADGEHLYLAVGIPQQVAYAALHHLLKNALLGAALVVLIAWLVIWKGADGLVLGRVRALVAATRRLAHGDLSTRAGIRPGGGEIGELATAFDRMAETLQLRAGESAQAEAALKRSEARFRRLAENAADVIYRYALKPERGFEYVSPAATAMVGYTPDEHYADPDLGRKLAHPEDLLILDRLLRGEHVPPLIELRWRRRDGGVIWTEQRIVPIYDEQRQLIAIECIARDVTERKRAEQELQLLQTITAAVSAANDLESALRLALERVCEATGWALAQAWVPNVDGGALEWSSAWFDAPERAAFCDHSRRWQVRPDHGGLLARAWRTRAPVWVRDVSTAPEFSRRQQAQTAGLRAALAVPVLAGDDLEAVMEFFMTSARAEDEHRVRTVAGVAAQLGSVLRQKRSEARLSYLAHHDLLTDLPNRALFNDRLRQAMREADRYERLVGVAFLDLDRFKTINDSLGHEIGDMLLKAVAERLSQCVRAADTVARISGDEFTLVLPDLGHVDDAARVAQKIVDHFHEPFRIAGIELYVTASIGITLYPFDDTDVKGLLRNADVAMYRAKEKGRNTYQFYAAEMTVRAQEQLSLEGALRRALEREEFVLEYQPVVDFASGHIVGAEALLRWHHPTRGLVPPGQFIPLAEETGLIVPIGAWVIARACAQGAKWQRLGFDRLRLAVNISPRQFEQPDLKDVLTAALRETGMTPTLLELEITETLLMRNQETTLATLAALNRMGLQLAIDDFGTGYSSLSYLKRFAIDRLKIDRSFVKDIPNDADDTAITTAIIAMAHKLGLEVVAEGVETAAQSEFLRANGCDGMQGFYFSRPIDAEAFTQLLTSGKRLAPPATTPRRAQQGGE